MKYHHLNEAGEDVFISKGNNFFTEDNIQRDNDFYKLYKSIFPDAHNNYSFYQLIEIFPEAKGIIKQILNREIKQCKQDLSEAREMEYECTKIISKIYKNRAKAEYFYWDRYVWPLKEGREEHIKKNKMYLAALNPNKMENSNPNNITDQDIARAKQVPIERFLKLNKAGFCKCPMQPNDSIPSLKVYLLQNTWFCYSCNIGGDVITLIQKIKNIRFKEAVQFLINK